MDSTSKFVDGNYYINIQHQVLTNQERPEENLWDFMACPVHFANVLSLDWDGDTFDVLTAGGFQKVAVSYMHPDIRCFLEPFLKGEIVC